MIKPLSEMTVDELYDFILIATKYAPSHESVDALNSWHELASRFEEAEKDTKRLERIFHYGKRDGTIPPGWIEYGQWKAKIDAAMAKE
jgi:hypothetical protein